MTRSLLRERPMRTSSSPRVRRVTSWPFCITTSSAIESTSGQRSGLHPGRGVVIIDAKTDLHSLYHQAAAEEGIGSVLAVPISVKDEVIGMLRLLSTEVRAFSGADINFAMAVAEQGGLAIQRAMDYARMQQMLAGSDPG